VPSSWQSQTANAPLSGDESHLQALCAGDGDERRTAAIGVISVVHPQWGWFAFADELNA
jgi:hypothetical protein